MARKSSRKPKHPNLYYRFTKSGEKRVYVEFHFQGKRYKFPYFSTDEEAIDFLERTRSDLRNSRAFPERYQAKTRSVADACTAYLTTHKHLRSHRDDSRYAAFWSDYFRGRALTGIRLSEVNEAKDYLLNSGTCESKGFQRGANTVNNYLAFLRKVFNAEEAAETLAVNPLRRLKLFKPPPKRQVVLTEADERTLMPFMGQSYWWLRLAVLTGMRQSDQFLLQWKQVDFARKIIEFPHPKSGRPEAIPMNEETLQILRHLWDTHTSTTWVFPDPEDAASPFNIKRWARWHFPKLLKAAGLAEKGITWHTLRHTFMTRQLQAGTPLFVAMKLGRWRSPTVAKGYEHLELEHLRPYAEKLSHRWLDENE